MARFGATRPAPTTVRPQREVQVRPRRPLPGGRWVFSAGTAGGGPCTEDGGRSPQSVRFPGKESAPQLVRGEDRSILCGVRARELAGPGVGARGWKTSLPGGGKGQKARGTVGDELSESRGEGALVGAQLAAEDSGAGSRAPLGGAGLGCRPTARGPAPAALTAPAANERRGQRASRSGRDFRSRAGREGPEPRWREVLGAGLRGARGGEGGAAATETLGPAGDGAGRGDRSGFALTLPPNVGTRVLRRFLPPHRLLYSEGFQAGAGGGRLPCFFKMEFVIKTLPHLHPFNQPTNQPAKRTALQGACVRPSVLHWGAHRPPPQLTAAALLPVSVTGSLPVSGPGLSQLGTCLEEQRRAALYSARPAGPFPLLSSEDPRPAGGPSCCPCFLCPDSIVLVGPV